MPKRKDYKELGDVRLPIKEDKRIQSMIEEAEQELLEVDTRVSFRWGKDQLRVVKHAAKLMGIPYQTFLKLAVYERALVVLKGANALTKKGHGAV
jgi:predicted DNA binding CopG/RHH family protein